VRENKPLHRKVLDLLDKQAEFARRGKRRVSWLVESELNAGLGRPAREIDQSAGLALPSSGSSVRQRTAREGFRLRSNS